jgi:DNA-binding NtrC family response regulator
MARMRRLLFRGAPGPAAEARLATVLVVDQREDALIIAGTALHSRGGFRVLLAKGAPEGERRAALEKPDAVLLDTGLSGVDLPQYVQRLARQAGAGGAAIILSADSESAAAAFAVQSPAVKGTLEKPFKPLLLAQEIERLLGKPPAANRQPHVDDAHLRKEIQRIMEPAP